MEMQFSDKSIIKRIFKFKSNLFKTGIFLALAAYWCLILVGTFISFN